MSADFCGYGNCLPYTNIIEGSQRIVVVPLASLSGLCVAHQK
jgi:hypothetical protein